MSLAQPRVAERERVWSALQAALRLQPQPFGRHKPSAGRLVSGLSPRGDGDARGIEPRAHRQAGRLGSGPALGPQSSPCRRSSDGGFTLIELLVVVALIAITSATISLALRDPTELQLQREAQRLAALLETARAESRASGLAVRWIPKSLKTGEDFQFTGLPKTIQLPSRWLGDPVAVTIENATAVNPGLVLGPEPIIPAQRLRLQLGERRVVLGTDGLAAFEVVNP